MTKNSKEIMQRLEYVQANLYQSKSLESCFTQDADILTYAEIKSKYVLAQKLINVLFDTLAISEEGLNTETRKERKRHGKVVCNQ